MKSITALTHPIHAIIGLGNPGEKYADTRHNVGAWFTEHLMQTQPGSLRHEDKLFGHYGKLTIAGNDVHVLIPSTFMNCSGQAVAALCQYYKVDPNNLLVVHDELDFEVGKSRLKFGGGHGGHNGLRDIIKAIGADFFRLRIGIGHPGNKNDVTDYVLKRPSKSDHIEIINSIDDALRIIEHSVAGKWEKAIQQLHSEN